MSIPNCWDNGKEIDHTKYICLAPIGALDNHNNYDAPLENQKTFLYFHSVHTTIAAIKRFFMIISTQDNPRQPTQVMQQTKNIYCSTASIALQPNCTATSSLMLQILMCSLMCWYSLSIRLGTTYNFVYSRFLDILFILDFWICFRFSCTGIVYPPAWRSPSILHILDF